MLLQYALPYVLWVCSVGYEKCKVKSQVTRRVLWRNLLYQLATLYVFVISRGLSTAWDAKLQLSAIMDRAPNDWLGSWSEEVPPVACYFISYVITRVGISLPMLLWFPLFSCSGPIYPDFAYEAANLGLVLVLGLTYSVIAPVILPVCMVYFAFAFLVYSWLFRFVYKPEFDCAGAFWHELFTGAVVGLLFGTLSLASLVGSSAGWDSNSFIALLVLAAIILIFFGCIHHYFVDSSRFVSLEDASEADAMSGDAVASMLSADYYVDPILKRASETISEQEKEEEVNDDYTDDTLDAEPSEAV